MASTGKAAPSQTSLFFLFFFPHELHWWIPQRNIYVHRTVPGIKLSQFSCLNSK